MQHYTINWKDEILLPENIINDIKNKYLQKTIKLNVAVSSGNICCTDYNAWITLYPKAQSNDKRLFKHLNANTETFYCNRKIINISINKSFYNRHGFPKAIDKNEA